MDLFESSLRKIGRTDSGVRVWEDFDEDEVKLAEVFDMDDAIFIFVFFFVTESIQFRCIAMI